MLAKLGRALPDLSVRLAGARSLASSSGDEAYGEIEYAYGGRRDVSRSTSPREILPLIYGLADVPPPAAALGDDYPGFPLIADAAPALWWFLGALPLAIVLAWYVVRRPPHIDPAFVKQATQEESHANQ